MKALWLELKAWVASKGGWEHVLVIAYTAFFLWFKMSPAFQALMLDLWTKTPAVLQSLVEAVVQILAVYGITGTAKVAVKAVFLKKPTTQYHK